MGKIVAGTFNGAGAAINIGIGFIPDWVKVQNLEGTDSPRLYWNRDMRAAECIAGFQALQKADSDVTGEFDDIDPKTVGTGIAPYRGGAVVAAGNATILTKLANRDQRAANVANGYTRITTWTLGNSGNKTGNWNDQANTTYVGEGSEVIIRETAGGAIKRVVVTAMTSNGEAANETTLSEAVASGDVLFIGPMYDYVAQAAGEVSKAGFTIDETANINVSGELCMFEAGTYDN